MLVHPQFNPVALALGPVQIHWYGLTYLVAFALFMALANARARQPAFAHAGWTMRCSTSRAITEATRSRSWRCGKAGCRFTAACWA